MVTSIIAHAAFVLGAQAFVMPPTPEQIAPRLASIPRCVPLPAAAPIRGGGPGRATSRADQIADGLRRAADRFPTLSCKEGHSK